MAEVLLSCEMLKDEIELAMKNTGSTIPIEWVDSGLHEYPEKLRAELDKRIELLEQTYDTILMGFCLCGNATVGVGAKKATLVAPRFDDCIRMLLCSKPGSMPDVDCHCLYFTNTWTQHEEFIGHQYERACEKYGPKKGAKVYACMLKNYTGIRLVDTGAYDLNCCSQYVKDTAQTLQLEYGEVSGTIRGLEKLLRHEWDEEFYVLQPGETFEQMKFLRRPED